MEDELNIISQIKKYQVHNDSRVVRLDETDAVFEETDTHKQILCLRGSQHKMLTVSR